MGIGDCAGCPQQRYTTGVQYSGKICFIEPQRVGGHRRPVPDAPSSDTPRESHAKFRDGTVWGIEDGSCGYRAQRVSIRGTFVLSKTPGYKTRGVAM